MIPSPALSQALLGVREVSWLLRPVPKAASTLLKRLAMLAEGRTPPEQAIPGETRPALAVPSVLQEGFRCFSQANRVWGEGDFRATVMWSRAVAVT